MATRRKFRAIWLATFLFSTLLPCLLAQEPRAAAAKPPELPPTNDAREIVRRSVEIDHQNWLKARNYTCQQRTVEKELDKNSRVKSQKIKTHDITFFYDEPYARLIQVDDKPLNDKEQKKEEEKLQKFLDKRKNESPDEHRKRLAKQEKERQEQRAFVRDIENAYDFRLLGEEQIAGVDTYVIEATPRKGFHPTQPHADMLSKVKGKLWIDKQGYNWVRAEAEAIDTISFGLFLARLHKGSRLSFEQTHVNDEVWLMHKFFINASARLMLLKNAGIEQEDTFSNYKKFTTAIRILPGMAEAPPEKPAPPK